MKKIDEPFNCISHGLSALLGSIGFGVLLYLADRPTEYFGVSLFGCTLVFLYTMSALYHGLAVSPQTRTVFRILDQVGIYFLIAGTVSPIALIALRGWDRWAMLGLIWLFAVMGSFLTILDPFDSSWVPTFLYLSMGWIPIAFIDQLFLVFSPAAIAWCLIGALLYTVGAVIYLFDWPRLASNRFGGHELWHIFTILGSGSHFILISTYML